MINEHVENYAKYLVSQTYDSRLLSSSGNVRSATIITILEMVLPLIGRMKCFNRDDGRDAVEGFAKSAAKDYDKTVDRTARTLRKKSLQVARQKAKGLRGPNARDLRQNILEHWTLSEDEAYVLARTATEQANNDTRAKKLATGMLAGL